MAAAYFVLKSGSTYEWRSKKSGFLYVFSGSTPKRVVDPGDQLRFRGMTDIFVETDETGQILDRRTNSAIPMSFTRKGMVPPKSYVKLNPTPPPPPPPRAAVQPSRVIVSSKLAQEPAPKAEPVPIVPTPVAIEADAGQADEVAAESEPSEGVGASSGDTAPTDGEPARRIKRAKKSGRKVES